MVYNHRFDFIASQLISFRICSYFATQMAACAQPQRFPAWWGVFGLCTLLNVQNKSSINRTKYTLSTVRHPFHWTCCAESFKGYCIPCVYSSRPCCWLRRLSSTWIFSRQVSYMVHCVVFGLKPHTYLDDSLLPRTRSTKLVDGYPVAINTEPVVSHFFEWCHMRTD